MSMVKMTYIDIYGPEDDPKQVFETLAKLQCFHPDSTATTIVNHTTGIENVYKPLVTLARGILHDVGADAKSPKYEDKAFAYDDARKTVESLTEKVAKRNTRTAEVQAQLTTYAQTKAQLYHLTGLTTKMDDIFAVKFLKVRFGRLPKDSYLKLPYYNDKSFTFNTYDFDGEYYWGMYFASEATVKEADEIFQSLYFERVWVPDFVHGTPQDALAGILVEESKLSEELAQLKDTSDVLSETEIKKVRDILAWANYEAQIFDMGQYAMSLEYSYFIGGYVPTDKLDMVKTELKKLPGVNVQEAQQDENAPEKSSSMQPPVKLKNNWFARPFEMFVEMYGLPSYYDIDPTGFVAITYAVLFGIMFGDIGQGILLGIIGYFIMYKKMNMTLGRLISHCSFFSVIFGLIYGSVFGFENATNWFWQLLGREHQPLEVMEPQSTNFILIFSIACGAFIIIAAMIAGVISKVKRGAGKDAVFGVNGMAGLIFYVSIILLAVDLVTDFTLPFVGSVPYIVLFIGLPVLSMYFAEPLTDKLKGEKYEGTVGSMLTDGFFELFDTLISFASNTMSFLRVGAFVLAHAGMMAVVFTLANMNIGNTVVYWIIVVLGNLFVMGLEALFVAIQVLRLEFYEMFSRYYEANGTPFTPLKVTYGTEN